MMPIVRARSFFTWPMLMCIIIPAEHTRVVFICFYWLAPDSTFGLAGFKTSTL